MQNCVGKLCKTVGEKQCKTVQTQWFQLFNYWNEKNYGRSAGGKTTGFSVPFQMFEKVLNRQHKVCKCDSQQWIKSAYINIFWRIKIICWEIFTFWGQIYHFYGSFITLGWPLHFIKSTRKILTWFRPPPLIQYKALGPRDGEFVVKNSRKSLDNLVNGKNMLTDNSILCNVCSSWFLLSLSGVFHKSAWKVGKLFI